MRNSLIMAMIAAGFTGMAMPTFAQEGQPGQLTMIVQDNFLAPENGEDGFIGLLVEQDDDLLVFDDKNAREPGDRMERPAGPPPPMRDKEAPGECPMKEGKPDGCPCAGKDCAPEKGEKMQGLRGPHGREMGGRQGCHGGREMGNDGDRKGPMDGARRGGMEQPMMMKYMSEKYAAEMAEIQQLRRQSEEVRKLGEAKLRELMKKAGEEMKARQEKMEQFKKDVQEYKKTKDAKLLAKIEAQVGAFYTEKLDMMKKRIAAGESKLKEMSADYERQAAAKEQEIIKRVKELTAITE